MLGNVQYIFDNDGQLIDTTTGELIDLEEIKKAKENIISESLTKAKDELRELGLKSELVLIKYKGEEYNCVSIKQGYTFGKVFRVAVRDLIENEEISKNAGYFIFILMPYIYFPTNSIVYHGKTPTLKELEKITNLKKSALYETLRELEEKEVIKKIKRDGNIIIYFNPFLYSSGAFVLKDTFELFKDSKYNPNYIV